VRRYLRDPTFSHFDTIPECDGHTHTHTDTRRRHIPRLARRRAVKMAFIDMRFSPQSGADAKLVILSKFQLPYLCHRGNYGKTRCHQQRWKFITYTATLPVQTEPQPQVTYSENWVKYRHVFPEICSWTTRHTDNILSQYSASRETK